MYPADKDAITTARTERSVRVFTTQPGATMSPSAVEPPDLPDYSTKAGAKLLMATIRNYWKFRGYNISAEVFEVPGAPRHFGVRTNLVNGCPRAAPVRLAA